MLPSSAAFDNGLVAAGERGSSMECGVTTMVPARCRWLGRGCLSRHNGILGCAAIIARNIVHAKWTQTQRQCDRQT
jgi:hypothetical protein